MPFRTSEACLSEMPAASRIQRAALALRVPESSQESSEGAMVKLFSEEGSLAKTRRSIAIRNTARLLEEALRLNGNCYVWFPTGAIQQYARTGCGLSVTAG